MHGQGFLTEKAKIIAANAGIKPQDISGTAATSAWVGLTKGRRLCWIISCGAWAGGTPAVTVNQASDSAGTGSKAVSFTRCYTQNGGSNDTPTEVTGLSGSQSLVNAANQILIIEIDASDLDVNNGFKFVQLAVASPGVNADLLCAIGIVYDLGISGRPSTLPTALS